MVEWIEPGKTIGIVGGGHRAYHLSLAAKRLGYTVGILANDRNCIASEVCDWVLEKPLNDPSGFANLSMHSDVVMYATETFNAGFVNTMQKSVPVPQGEDLLSVSQDRILQKVFFESIRMNIAPYSTVVSLEDIQESVDSIGYPCILKSNQVEDDKTDQIILNDDSDIQKATPIIEAGTSVLEASLDVERNLVVSLVKDQYNNTAIFPISEIQLDDDKLSRSISPIQIDSEVEEEIMRIIERISSQFTFVGSISVELFLTSNGFIYVNELSTQTHQVLTYTRDFTSMSHYEAQIKAVCGMPLPGRVNCYAKTVVVPFYSDQLQSVYQQMQIKPEWLFTFYPAELISGEIGYIIIPTADVEKTNTLLDDINL